MFINLKCELFEYEDEVIDTSIDDIDRQIEDEGYITTLKLIGIGVTATASAVINTGYVRQVFLNNDGSGFTSPPVITFEDPLDNTGTTATAVGILTTVGGITSPQRNCFNQCWCWLYNNSKYTNTRWWWHWCSSNLLNQSSNRWCWFYRCCFNHSGYCWIWLSNRTYSYNS